MRVLFLLIWALGLCLFASVMAYAELRIFVTGSSSDAAREQSYVDGSIKSGFSDFSHDILMRDCMKIIPTLGKIEADRARRDNALAHCWAETNKITERLPTHSFAWLTRAWLAILRGNLEEMNASLTKSRISGPNEQWIAIGRVRLSERYYASLSAVNLAGNAVDLVMLMQNQTGVEAIAKRYVEVPAFRARVRKLAEQLSQQDRRNFVEKVRRAARDLGHL